MRMPSLLRKPFRYEFWNAAFIIIGLNMLMYILTMRDYGLIALFSMRPRDVLEHGMIWQVFTYQFVHSPVDLSHIFFNMLAVFIFGMSVERRVGSKEFLLMYLLSGTLSGLLSLIAYTLTGQMNVALMGASGAVFSLLFAYAVLFPRSLIYIWGILPIPAPLLVGLYALIEIVSLLGGSRDGVAHGTHLFGFAVAWAYFVIRFGIHPLRVWRRQ
jgi:membrane associated rhomboid family serine protease